MKKVDLIFWFLFHRREKEQKMLCFTDLGCHFCDWRLITVDGLELHAQGDCNRFNRCRINKIAIWNVLQKKYVSLHR